MSKKYGYLFRDNQLIDTFEDNTFWSYEYLLKPGDLYRDISGYWYRCVPNSLFREELYKTSVARVDLPEPLKVIDLVLRKTLNW